VSQGVLVRELLEAVQPALERVAGLLEVAEKARDKVPDALRSLLDDENSEEWDGLPFDLDLWRAIAAEKRAPGALAEPGVNPRPVTRGLGWTFGDPGHPTDPGRLELS
jgi:hypothetical protein